MTTTRKTARVSLIGLLIVPFLLTLAACAVTPQPDSPDPGDTQIADAKQWALDYAACMREHGIDMEDPNANGGSIGLGPEDETPERQAATEACLEELGPSPAGGGSQGSDGGPSIEEMRDELLALADCLRDLGYDVKDPAPGEGIAMPADLTEEAIEQCAEFAPPAVPAQ